MKDTLISWCDHSWNPITGCSKVSPGCDHCYAEVIAERFRGKAFPNGFDFTVRPQRLHEPLSWKKPARIFVSSMSDVFHVEMPDDYLRQMWDVMIEADWHIFLVLTKRTHRMVWKVKDLGLELPPHIWLGTSVENQKFADNRLPALLSIPAAKRWVSAEPLIGPVDLNPYLHGLDWVITGGESGGGRRFMDYNWVRSVRNQCARHSVSFYHKQGNHNNPGQDRVLDRRTHDDWPAPEEWQEEVSHGSITSAQATLF